MVFKLMYSSYSNNPMHVRTTHSNSKSSRQRTIEFGVLAMKIELRLEEKDIFTDQWSISCSAMSAAMLTNPQCSIEHVRLAKVSRKSHTSHSFTTDASHQTINPIGVLLSLSDHDRVSFLENFVDGLEGLERLDFVGKNGLPVIMIYIVSLTISCNSNSSKGIPQAHIHLHARPEGCRRFVVPRVHDTTAHMLPCTDQRVSVDRNRSLVEINQYHNRSGILIARGRTYVSVRFPLSRHRMVSPIHPFSPGLAGTPLGPSTTVDIPILVAFRMLMAKSASVLRD